MSKSSNVVNATTHKYLKQKLIDFEAKVAQAFRDKLIRAPIHLSGGNEDQLIEIFRDVKHTDWVISNWRSHYHALLHSIDENWLFNEILAGHSMFMASSIVGGMLPIACGLALAYVLGRNPNREYAVNLVNGIQVQVPTRVWVFVGDMTARTGLFHETLQYAIGHQLPMTFVVEDNGLSTDTPTDKVWGYDLWLGNYDDRLSGAVKVKQYKYQRTWPHVGVGEHVSF